MYGGVRIQCAMRAYSWRAARVRCAYVARTLRVRCAYGARTVRAVCARCTCDARAVCARCAHGAPDAASGAAGAQCGPLRSSTLRLCGEKCVCRDVLFLPHLICLSKYDVFFECAFDAQLRTQPLAYEVNIARVT